MKQSLRDIVNRSIKGDQKAYKQLYDEFAPPMLGICMRYTGSRSEAQDVLHDGFVKVFERLHTLHNADAFGPWIYKIMVRTAINYVQRNSNKYVELVEVEQLEDAMTIDYDQYDVQYLLDIIQKIPANPRMVFNLYEIDGYSCDEIAQQMGITESSVRCYLARARQSIQEKLKNYER